MKAEVVSIGSEITSGHNLDTNTQWLSLRLAELGIPVGFHTTVADDFDDNVGVFRTAAGRAGVVISTGGLGPTLDDLTREVLAKLAGVDLEFHQPTWDHVVELFERRGRTVPERNKVQAMFPIGAEVLPNPIGTAPGLWMKIGPAIVAAMPGVPSEMHRMFEEQVRPRLVALGLGGHVLIQRKINTFGAGESAVEEKVADLTRRGHVPEVGITASDAIISLRIFARAPTLEEARAQCEPVERTIRERLGEWVFGVEDEGLQHAVARLLGERKLTIATAESITAGLVSRRLAEVPGISMWFLGGVVCYDSCVKTDLLGVPKEVIDAHTAVSNEAAIGIATGVRRLFKADLGVGVVGYAGPDAGPDEKPVGTTFVAVASAAGVETRQFLWFGTRAEIQSRAATMALDAVRLHLMRGK